MLTRLALVAVLAATGATLPQVEAAVDVPAQARATAAPAAFDANPAASNGPVGRAALPALTADDAAAEDVTVTELDVVVAPVDASGDAVETPDLAAARADDDAVATDEVVADRVLSEVVEAGDFQTVGVTWPEDVEVGDPEIEVRTRADGEWSEWVHVEAGDAAPDAGTADASSTLRGGTDSLWVGDADAVQLSFPASVDGGPAGMSLTLVDVPEIETDAGAGTASATSALYWSDGPASAEPTVATALWSSTAAAAVEPVAASAPTIITREQWGARAQVCTPDVATTKGLVGAVVHHTAGSNDYATVADAMRQIRGDQSYHIDGRGWCDIGYNFLVDKWGNIYEGRARSSTQPVIGVHAGGFNTGTVGISMLGSYGSVTPPAATQESVARIVAWRLGQYHRDPAGTLVYHTLGGENSKFPAGADVTLPVVFSHRDVGNTACPGEAGYSTIPWVRARARQLVGTSFINPSASPGSFNPGSSVTVRAATINNINWRLEVTHAVSGAAITNSIGYAQQAAGGVVATWDGRDSSGNAVGVGVYRLTLTGTDATSGSSVVPFSATVQVTRDPNPPVVDPVPLVGDLAFVPVTPQRLLDTRESGVPVGPQSRTDVVVAGVDGIPADAKAVALNVTAVNSSSVTFVRVWPAGQPSPTTSNLNTDERRTTAAGVVVGVGGEGKVSLYNNAGTTHLVIDVTGYFTDDPAAGSDFGAMSTGARIHDSRTGAGKLTSGERRTLQVAGVQGIPSDAVAVIANITSVLPSGAGNISAFPSGGAVPVSSSVNHLPGDNVTNRTIVPLDAQGRMDLALQGAPADVVVDVVGWFGSSGTLQFTPIVPERAIDTRGVRPPLGRETQATVPVTTPSIPSTAAAVLVNLTATQQTNVTFMSLWRAGGRPLASDLNTGAGRDQANLAVVVPDGSGHAQVYNDRGSLHFILDTLGYFD